MDPGDRFPPPDGNLNGRNFWKASTYQKWKADALAGKYGRQSTLPRAPSVRRAAVLISFSRYRTARTGAQSGRRQFNAHQIHSTRLNRYDITTSDIALETVAGYFGS